MDPLVKEIADVINESTNVTFRDLAENPGQAEELALKLRSVLEKVMAVHGGPNKERIPREITDLLTDDSITFALLSAFKVSIDGIESSVAVAAMLKAKEAAQVQPNPFSDALRERMKGDKE